MSTTAETLRGWADGAEESMREPLLALAQHAEDEISAAKVATETACLSVIAERLGAQVAPETFAIIDSIGVTLLALEESSSTHKTSMTERDAAKAALGEYRDAVWSIARACGIAPEDHDLLNVHGVVSYVGSLVRRLEAVQKALAP